MNNIAIYARVSTKDQDCSNQLLELRSYVKARDWPEAKEYVDTGWSGSKSSRPKLNELMKDALARKIDTIIVVRIDRWGRSVLHLSSSLAELRSAGVRFIATTQGIDTDANNPVASLLLGILSLISEFEKSLIRERVAAGMKRAKATGTKSGKPIGRPQLIVNRQAVWDLRDAGMSIRKIQAETGLSRGTVTRILGVAHK